MNSQKPDSQDFTRRAFLKKGAQTVLASSALPLLTGAFAADKIQKPNVLFIIIDDQNTRIGAYGDKIVKTPHIDALAQSGLRFDRAYCQNPICQPSRSSFLTGMRPETLELVDNIGNFREAIPDAVTLPRYFRNNGYKVASVGKVFHPGEVPPHNDPVLARSINCSQNNLVEEREEIKAAEEEFKAVYKGAQYQYYWGALDCPDEATDDGQSALAAIKFLKENKDQSFFLTVGFSRPHLPFVAPKKYFDLYPPESMPVAPADEEANDEALKEAQGSLKNGLVSYMIGRRKISPDLQKRIIAAYSACVSFVDAQIGLILNALKEAQLDKNTIVVLIGDNGFMLGEHEKWGKVYLYEESVRIPLIVSVPGVTAAGTATTGLVELVDVYPTLAQLAGLKVPDGLEGSSFVPLLKNPSRNWKKAVFSENSKGDKMVRTQDWKYISTGDGQEKLFDEVNDPNERTNLVDSPKFEKILRQHDKFLQDRWKKFVP